MTKKPAISIIMPVWNGETYLREAVESVLKQTFQDFEFLVLNDGSTDATAEILAEYAARDPRIHIIPLDHRGIVVALNRGVNEARSEWVARMDCDDIAHPKRLELQWRAIQQHPEAALCHTNIQFIGEAEHIPKTAYFPRSQALIHLKLCFLCPISHPTVMFRKAPFENCGGYMAEERHAEDYGLWARICEKYEIIGIPQTLLSFRSHNNSISKKAADFQIPLSQTLAISNCRKFMMLNDTDAIRAYNILSFQENHHRTKDWLWLAIYCIPRLKRQSVELWAWVFVKILRSLL